MKKSSKIVLIVLAVLLAVIIIGFSIFLYIHGNTKPYSVSDDIHQAIESQKVDKGEGEVRIMSSNLLVYYPSWHGSGSRNVRDTDARPRYKIYEDILKTFEPDVMGVQEVCDRWFNCLMRNDLGYKFVQPAKTAFTVRLTNLMYNSNTTNLIESGSYKYSKGDNPRLRCIVWGLFEDKATGKQYIVTSTHFDLIRSDKEASLKTMQTQMQELLEQSKLLKETYNVPVYHTGDFNTVNNIENWVELYPEMSPEGIEKLKEKEETIKIDQAPSIYTDLAAQLPDAKLIAEEFNAIGTTTIETPTYDHIFVNGDTPIVRYVSISDPLLIQMSDHNSIFIDAKLA